MICMKNLRFSSRPRAKVRRQGPPGSARAQPVALGIGNWALGIYCFEVTHAKHCIELNAQ